jgi:hypothetical protein
MEEDTHLPRLRCGSPIPLTLLAQRARTATRHTPDVGSRQPLDAAHAAQVLAQQDNGASHLAGEQSRSRRNDHLSRATPLLEKRSPMGKRRAQLGVGGPLPRTLFEKSVKNRRRDRPKEKKQKISQEDCLPMQDAFSPLCTVWNEQVKQFFTNLHGLAAVKPWRCLCRKQRE